MGRRRLMRLLAAMGGGMLAQIMSWQAQNLFIMLAGKPEAAWSNVTYVGSDRTYIIPRYACRRRGKITRVVLRAHTSGVAWTLRLYRWNGSTYDAVVGSARTITPTQVDGTTTLNLADPISCEPGDIPGIYFPPGQSMWEDTASESLPKRYVDGDQTSDAFASTNGGNFNISFYGPPPYLAITGDSIAEGTNVGASNHWNSYTRQSPIVSPDTGVKSFPGGDSSAEWGKRMNDLLFGGSRLSWENSAQTSKKFDWGLSVGVPSALSANPHTLIVAYGTNDITAGITWEDTETRLEAIKALVDASSVKKFILCEILPRTGTTDVQAATIRSWNSNFSAWCSVNGVTLAVLHDAMGKLRPSTGELDDLATAYDVGDGVHLSSAGVDKYAQIISALI